MASDEYPTAFDRAHELHNKKWTCDWMVVGSSAAQDENMILKNTYNKVIIKRLFCIFLGVPPKDSSLVINALLIHHYKRGAYFPKGGASEIPFHIIRTIQKYGGNCLVRAPVSQILVNKEGAAYGKKLFQLSFHL